MSAEDTFKASFGAPPDQSGSAPGRVNLIGEHIDYNGGLVLPTALRETVDVAIRFHEQPTVSIKSERFEGTVERQASEPATGHWSDYAVGALAKAEALGWITGGGDVFIRSAVPDGAGVSSSAALITAILRAASKHTNASAAPVDIALHARSVENDYIGMPCGIMDQMAVGLARHGEALALDTVSLDTEIITIPQDWRFVTLHSGIQRKLSDGRYKQRFEECEAARKALNAEHLCLLGDTQRAAVSELPEPLARRARHVVTEHERVQAAIECMKTGDAAGFGTLMNESHTSYTEDFEASTPEIDALLEAARESGAVGARLTGGGFGGCIVCLLASGDAHDWASAFTADHPGTWTVSAWEIVTDS